MDVERLASTTTEKPCVVGSDQVQVPVQAAQNLGWEPRRHNRLDPILPVIRRHWQYTGMRPAGQADTLKGGTLLLDSAEFSYAAKRTI